MHAYVVERPETFDRVDRVKGVVGQEVLPGDDQIWILGQPLVVVFGSSELVAFGTGDRVTVPAGFTTDGASIPGFARWLTGWEPWDEPQRLPAIVHDWLYTQSGVSRHRADLAFRSLLHIEGAGRFKTEIMYVAVVIGGWPAYRTDQRQGPSVWV
jgi:hypothetical protein